MKSCSYTGITASEDAKVIYAVGSDRKLKEITDSTVCEFFIENFYWNITTRIDVLRF